MAKYPMVNWKLWFDCIVNSIESARPGIPKSKKCGITDLLVDLRLVFPQIIGNVMSGKGCSAEVETLRAAYPSLDWNSFIQTMNALPKYTSTVMNAISTLDASGQKDQFVESCCGTILENINNGDIDIYRCMNKLKGMYSTINWVEITELINLIAPFIKSMSTLVVVPIRTPIGVACPDHPLDGQCFPPKCFGCAQSSQSFRWGDLINKLIPIVLPKMMEWIQGIRENPTIQLLNQSEEESEILDLITDRKTRAVAFLMRRISIPKVNSRGLSVEIQQRLDAARKAQLRNLQMVIGCIMDETELSEKDGNSN